MAISYDEVRALREPYIDLYRPRLEAFRALRKYYHGDYWKLADYESSRPITSIFRDLTGHMSDVGPEIKLVYNVIQMVVNKYQTFLTPLPQIRVWADRETDISRAQATRKQRFLYGCWKQGEMDKMFAKIAWYLPLMGDCFLGVHPDFDRNIPVPILRSPEFACPIPSFDKNGEQAITFSWKVNESIVSKNFVEYQAPVEQMRAARRGKSKRGQNPNPQVEIVEYSDDNEWHRWIVPINAKDEQQLGAQEINGVVHKYGFNLFEHLKFIDIPDEPWGHGAVEQAINLNEMGNALYSLMFQAVIENVFPRLILENPRAAPEEIESGPGAVIPLNAGGKAYYLQPEGPMIAGQDSFMRANELNIRNATGMPGVNFGESPATSIVTGKAVNELQGAGTGSMIEMVQGVGIGNGIVSWNEKAITIAQRTFRDDTMNLFGAAYKSFVDLVPTQFQLTIKGKDLVGSPRNDVIFSPALSQHEKLVMGLQGLGGGIWSKKYVREQQGVIDNDQMVEEIYGEQITDAVLGGMMGAFQQDPQPQNAEASEKQAVAFLSGQTSLPAPAAHPLLGLTGGGGPPQSGAAAPPTPATAGAPPQNPQSPQAAQGQAQGVTLNEAAAAFQQVQGIQGRVFLVGQIVATGKTNGDIEVALTSGADRGTLSAGLPQYAGRLVFHSVANEPNEAFVECTPGRPIQRGGDEQQNPQALSGIGVG